MSCRTIALHLICAGLAFAADPPPASLAEAWPSESGLVVQVGAGSAAVLDGLTGTTRGRLVHGLVRGDELRDRLRGELHQRKLHPLATVATWQGAPELPYTDRLVNLLIIDRDDLGASAPSAAEARRVVAPGGAVLERKGGTWSVLRIERPATFGVWTHYDADAAGSSVGSDREMTGIRSWQWIDNVRDQRWEKTGPHGGHEGNIRIWDRYAVWDYDQLGKNMSQSSREKGRFPDVHAIVCRDVSNGLPVWRRDGDGG
ncbi:MAG: Serine/threonine-protein kinase AfsK, partial [Planctomycetota bacterium]